MAIAGALAVGMIAGAGLLYANRDAIFKAAAPEPPAKSELAHFAQGSLSRLETPAVLAPAPGWKLPGPCGSELSCCFWWFMARCSWELGPTTRLADQAGFGPRYGASGVSRRADGAVRQAVETATLTFVKAKCQERAAKMGEEGEEAARSFDETREQLLEGLDKARRLVKQAKFMRL